MAGGPTLYFIRHGETDWNAENRLQGQTDIPLNEVGRRQAVRNGRMLREIVPNLSAFDFVASPLSRAAETMRIARGEAGLEPSAFSTDDRLKEVHFGAWEGWRWIDLPTHDPVGYAARMANAFTWRPSGGESYQDLMLRAVDWLKSIERETVVVSHGGVSRVLRGYLYGLDPEELPDLKVPQDKILLLRRTGMEWL
jgi:probable phosphoglycerate mutase